MGVGTGVEGVCTGGVGAVNIMGGEIVRSPADGSVSRRQLSKST